MTVKTVIRELGVSKAAKQKKAKEARKRIEMNGISAAGMIQLITKLLDQDQLKACIYDDAGTDSADSLAVYLILLYNSLFLVNSTRVFRAGAIKAHSAVAIDHSIVTPGPGGGANELPLPVMSVLTS